MTCARAAGSRDSDGRRGNMMRRNLFESTVYVYRRTFDRLKIKRPLGPARGQPREPEPPMTAAEL